MKRSRVVALVAIGIGPLALAACDRRPECRQGDPPGQDCRPASSAHGGGIGATSRAGETTTDRGGFGGTGEAASGGGEGGGAHGGGGE